MDEMALLPKPLTPKSLKQGLSCHSCEQFHWTQNRAQTRNLQGIGFVGWFHGAGSILDALAQEPPKTQPTGLSEATKRGLNGLKAAVAVYPYCSFPSAMRSGWSKKTCFHGPC